MTVKVVDKSQWPPVVSTLTVTAITADETYPSGIPLGKVHASDFDPYDVLVYSLLETPNSASFTIDPSNGTLKSLTPLRAGSYELGIGVSDGRWTARGDAYVKIVTLTSLMPDMKLNQAHFGENEEEVTLPPHQHHHTHGPPTGRKGDENQKGTGSGLSSSHYHNVKSRKDISSFAVVLTLKGHNPQSLLTRIFALINAIKEAMGLEPQGGSLYDVVILSVQSAKEDTFLMGSGSASKTSTHTLPVQRQQQTKQHLADEQSSPSRAGGETRRKRDADAEVISSLDSGTSASESIEEAAAAAAHLHTQTLSDTPSGDSIVPAVDILMAVRKSTDGSFVAPIELVKKLRFAQPQIESVLSAKMTRLTYDICREDSCERGQ